MLGMKKLYAILVMILMLTIGAGTWGYYENKSRVDDVENVKFNILNLNSLKTCVDSLMDEPNSTLFDPSMDETKMMRSILTSPLAGWGPEDQYKTYNELVNKISSLNVQLKTMPKPFYNYSK